MDSPSPNICPIFTPENFQRTLEEVVNSLKTCRGLELNLAAKKHIKEISYSKDTISLSLNFIDTTRKNIANSSIENVISTKGFISKKKVTNHLGRGDESKDDEVRVFKMAPRVGLEPTTK